MLPLLLKKADSSLQDDFDDLCDTLADRLGQPSTTPIPDLHQKSTFVPALSPEEKSTNKLAHSCSVSLLQTNANGWSTTQSAASNELSCNKILAPAPATEKQPGNIEAAKLHIDNHDIMMATRTSSLEGSSTTELVQFAVELQTLAEMTGRLRRALDRLLALPDCSLSLMHACPSSDQVGISRLAGASEDYKQGKGLPDKLLRSVETLQMAEAELTEEKVRLSSSLEALFELTGTVHDRPVASDDPAIVRRVADGRLQARVGSKSADVGWRTLWVQERLLLAVESLSAKLQSGHGISQSPVHASALPLPIANTQKALAQAASAVSLSAAPHAGSDNMVLSTFFTGGQSESGCVKVGQDDSEKESYAVRGRAESVTLRNDDCRRDDWGQVKAGGGWSGTSSSIGGGGYNRTAPNEIHLHTWGVAPAAIASQQANTKFEGLVANQPAFQPAITPGSLPSLSSTIHGNSPRPPGHWEELASPHMRNGTEVFRTAPVYSGTCGLASPRLRSCSDSVRGGQAVEVGNLLQAPAASLSAQTLKSPAHTPGVAIAMEAAVDVTRYCV